MSIQKEKPEQYLFTDQYEEATRYFRGEFRSALGKWKSIAFDQYPIIEGLTIDSYRCDPFQNLEKLLVITGGEHGIEGYTCLSFLDIFRREFLPLLDRNHTGLCVLLPINPWGMKYHRRVNERNVDLNRTFISDWKTLNREMNPNYRKATGLIQDDKPVRAYNLVLFRFFGKYMYYAAKMGFKGIKEALTMGQYQYPKGLYYGGTKPQRSTEYLTRYFDTIFSSCRDIVHLDIHTGAGRKNRMTIVNSAYSQGDSADYERKYGYSPVVKATKEEFYAMSGDMIDYINRVIPEKYPQTNFYSTCFEYGLMGESAFGKLRSRQAIIQENQAFHHGAESASVHRVIRNRFDSVFFSYSKKWQEAMIIDTRRALNGILKAHRFID
jgi:hypothetical protein